MIYLKEKIINLNLVQSENSGVVLSFHSNQITFQFKS